MSVETNEFRYFKSDCPHCRGAIEFLERGVVEKVVCPYCGKEIDIPKSSPPRWWTTLFTIRQNPKRRKLKSSLTDLPKGATIVVPRTTMKKRNLEGLFGCLLFFAIPALLLILIVGFLYGAAWASDKLLPILNEIATASLFIILLIFLPLSFFKKCRMVCSTVFILWSYFCGLCLWMTSLVVTLAFGGWIAVIVGLIFMGIGIFPIALFASILSGRWHMLAQLLFELSFVIASRGYGLYLVEKYDRESTKLT